MSDLLCELPAKGATVPFSSHQLDLGDGLCQDVVIIESGRVVQAGDLAGLRGPVPQRWPLCRDGGTLCPTVAGVWPERCEYGHYDRSGAAVGPGAAAGVAGEPGDPRRC
jgi:hypothetical protein